MGSSSSKPTKKTKTTTTITSVDRAILDLKNTRDKLQKYRSKLNRDETLLLQRAKEAKEAGRTGQALGLLRLKKHKTRAVESVEAQLLTVLQMVQTIDSRNVDVQVLGALRAGKDALAKLQQETTVEDILELMEQIQEQNQVEQEVADILSQVPALSVDDEAQVEAELDALMMSTLSLPQVPNDPLPSQKVPQPVPSKETGRVAVAS